MTCNVEQPQLLTTAPTADTNALSPASRTTKSAVVIKLLCRNKGATLREIMAITHWQAHSSRAFLTGLRKKDLVLLKETRRDGETSYRIDR